MSQLLTDIIAIGCRSLEQEEQSLRRETERKGQAGGLIAIDLICFCPYVFLRAVLPKYDAKHEFTREGRRVGELAVKFERKSYYLILDHWKDEPVDVLQAAVDRLALRRKAEACLIVLSANQYGETEGRQRLVDGLKGVAEKTNEHRFPTRAANGEELEFCVAAWRVPGRMGDEARAVAGGAP
jgi:hypothetical protein